MADKNLAAMPIAAPESGYVVYGSELSYFTRKLEAALQFYGAPYERRHKDASVRAEIEARAGTHQIPVLHTPENWMIADTTPLLALLDSRYPQRRLLPPGGQGIVVRVLEEYFDEWITRTMVHFRWHYPDSAAFAANRIARGDAVYQRQLQDWGPRACRATGTESVSQRVLAEQEYRRILDAMEVQLRRTRYLLGDRPTAVDCIVLGGLHAHTWMDPDPKRVVASYPTVIDWCERRAADWDGAGELAPFPECSDFARAILMEMPHTYRPFVLGNRAALLAGDKTFSVSIGGEAASFLTRPYPERSRAMVVSAIRDLPADEHGKVRAWLGRLELLDCFEQ